jgi:hypothetical protein
MKVYEVYSNKIRVLRDASKKTSGTLRDSFYRQSVELFNALQEMPVEVADLEATTSVMTRLVFFSIIQYGLSVRAIA